MYSAQIWLTSPAFLLTYVPDSEINFLVTFDTAHVRDITYTGIGEFKLHICVHILWVCYIVTYPLYNSQLEFIVTQVCTASGIININISNTGGDIMWMWAVLRVSEKPPVSILKPAD